MHFHLKKHYGFIFRLTVKSISDGRYYLYLFASHSNFLKAKHYKKSEFSNERCINICIYEAIIKKNLS